MLGLSNFVNDVIFQGDRRSYWHPAHFGLQGHPFTCQTSDGEKLEGLVIPAKTAKTGRLKGTVLFFHAAVMNLQFHLPQVAFLAEAGFHVVTFDYRGFGSSTGRSRLDTLETDAESVFNWLEHSDWSNPDLILFGQGVGADAALQLLHAHTNRFKSVILEAPYAHRGDWLRERWGPLIGDLAARVAHIDQIEPESILAQTRTPVLTIYPDHCSCVRTKQRRRVEAALTSLGETHEVSKAKFLGIFGSGRAEPQAKVLRFIAKSAPAIRVLNAVA